MPPSDLRRRVIPLARFKRFPLAPLLILWVLASTTAYAQTSAPPDIDSNAAEQHFGHVLKQPSLHEALPFPDGSKGYTLHNSFEPGMKLAIPPAFASAEDYSAFHYYCSADAIVLAKNRDSIAVLMSSKSSVYSVAHFSVLQVIKSDGHIAAGQIVATYRIGGQVVDQGETLKVETPDAPAYQPDKTYLLLLNRQQSAQRIQYWAPDFVTNLVAHDRVFPSVAKWAGFLPGTPYSQVVGTFNRVAGQQCVGSKEELP